MDGRAVKFGQADGRADLGDLYGLAAPTILRLGPRGVGPDEEPGDVLLGACDWLDLALGRQETGSSRLAAVLGPP